MKLIKLSSNHIASSLEHIFNDSIKNGYFPDKLKIKKIIPLHKSGSRLDITNYRPISLLPIFSKIFEQATLTRMKKFLDKNKIIFEHQYGFQKGKSTVHAVLDLI